MKSKYSEIFPYSEFYERLVNQYEEFLFYYKGKEINISYCSKNWLALAYGNRPNYFCKDYISSKQFLQDPIFDGKTIEEIWDELE